MLCQTCQIPMVFSEADDPTQTCYRESSYHGMKFHFCSDGCKDIFDDEPQKYAQAWLPVHQIYQGNCGGASLGDVLDWYRINQGADNLDFEGSQDQKNWRAWKGEPGAAA
jgi:phenol hydroxylase P3 protein